MLGGKFYKRPASVLLMSAFVLPGSGQFINGQIFKGVLVLLGSIVPFILILVHVFYFLYKNLSIVMDSMSSTGNVTEVPPVISIPFVIGLVLCFLFFYFYGLIDAYIVASRKWREEKNNL